MAQVLLHQEQERMATSIWILLTTISMVQRQVVVGDLQHQLLVLKEVPALMVQTVQTEPMEPMVTMVTMVQMERPF